MTRQARITCVISSLGPGGAERNMSILARHLRETGHDVVILTVNDTIDDFFPVPDGVQRVRLSPETYRLSCRWFDVCCQIDRWRHLRKEILATRPDLVVSFLDQVNIQVLMSLVGSGVPVIVSERSDPRQSPVTRRWDLLRMFAYTLSFRIVFVSQAVTDWARKRRPWWKGQWIPNPIYFDKDSEDESVSASNVADIGKRTIFALGRLSEEKGFDLLIEAFSRLAPRFPDWNLKIIGDGPLRDELTLLIQDRGLVGRVQLVGKVSPPFGLFRQGDLFVLSSRFEGFPNSLLEAMACGLPAISFDCQSGPSEIIRPAIDGLLVPPDDVSALSLAMERLMSDDAERKRMARNAPDVLKRYSKQRSMNLWDDMIGQALATRSGWNGRA